MSNRTAVGVAAAMMFTGMYAPPEISGKPSKHRSTIPQQERKKRTAKKRAARKARRKNRK